jgi:hypothetical protein
MAIRRVHPEDHKEADMVRVYSDAAENENAVREITQWASEHGFLRTREHHLNTVLTEMGRFYEGFCYRPEEAHQRAAAEAIERIEKRRNAMPRARDADELLREDG